MSESQSTSTHLSNPVKEGGRITLETALKAYKTWAADSSAYVESADQAITHKGFENLLGEARRSGVDISSILLSRLVERFNSLESHILNEYEVRSLMKRYPQVVFDDCWEVVDMESVDEVDLLLKSDADDEVMLVEIAFESDSRAALGTLLHERMRLRKYSDTVRTCLVTLDSDDYFREACRRAEVRHVELGPSSLVERVEECPEWSNLRGFTLSP